MVHLHISGSSPSRLALSEIAKGAPRGDEGSCPWAAMRFTGDNLWTIVDSHVYTCEMNKMCYWS